MSKKRFFIPLAAFSLLFSTVVACNANNNNPSGSSNTPASTSKQDGSSGGGASSSSSAAPAHTHTYGDTATKTVKNADQKNVSVYQCTENDNGKMMVIAFDDYSEKSADFGSTSSYTGVPQEIRESSHLLAKGSSISWKVKMDKAVTGAQVAFGMVYTGSDHGSQSLDGKYTVKVNSGSSQSWDLVAGKTYDGAGLAQTARNYIAVATINLVEGDNVITLEQGNGGYRLLFGGDVRVMYDGDADPVDVPFAGYDVAFTASHCTVLAYESGQNYAVDPVALTNGKTKARDEEGNIVAYSDDPNAAQPQVNFKVVPEAGYEVDTSCITISGVQGTDWNSLKDTAGTEYTVGEGDAAQKVSSVNTFRVTKIKGNLTITVTAVAEGTLAKGYAVTFNLEHCTVNVFKEKKFKTAETDVGPTFYSRNKNQIEGDYPYCKGENAQFNFVIVPEEGYEWKPNLSSAEVEADEVTFISPNGFNKLKITDGVKCNLTKVSRSLTIRITCTQVQA